MAPPYARPLARILLPDDSIVVDAGEYVAWSDAMYPRHESSWTSSSLSCDARPGSTRPPDQRAAGLGGSGRTSALPREFRERQLRRRRRRVPYVRRGRFPRSSRAWAHVRKSERPTKRATSSWELTTSRSSGTRRTETHAHQPQVVRLAGAGADRSGGPAATPSGQEQVFPPRRVRHRRRAGVG